MDIPGIVGTYKVVYSSTCNICDERIRKELDKEEVRIDHVADLSFNIQSEYGPTGKWNGSFRWDKTSTSALGDYKYECDKENNPISRTGTADYYILLRGKDNNRNSNYFLLLLKHK